MATIPPASRRRFRPAALPTLAALAAIAVCVVAGNWQRDRMHAKEALRARYDALSAAAPVELPAGPIDVAQWRYRRVRVTGEYAGSRQILLDNKVHAGRAGFHAIAPLRLPDGRYALVDRGWVVVGPTRADLPVVSPPVGQVTVNGRINIAVPAKAGAPAESGLLWQRLDPAALAAQLRGEVLPLVIEQDAGDGPGDGLVRAWTAPDFGIDKNRIYMGQWYAFAALAAFLWAWFGMRRTSDEPTP